jgi:hypothetical protein
MFARFSKQLPSKCVNAPLVESTLASTKPHEEQMREAMRVVCGCAATIDILHTVLFTLKNFWRDILQEGRAVDYIYADRYIVCGNGFLYKTLARYPDISISQYPDIPGCTSGNFLIL